MQTHVGHGQDDDAQRQHGQRAQHVQHGRAHKHARQGHLPGRHGRGRARGCRALPPGGQGPQSDQRDGRGGGHGADVERGQRQTDHPAGQRVHGLLVVAVEAGGVERRGRGAGVGVVDAGDAPAGGGHGHGGQHGQRGQQQEGGRGARPQHALGAQGADHAQAALARDDGGDQPRHPAEAPEAHQVVGDDEAEDGAEVRGRAGEVLVHPVHVEQEGVQHVQQVGQ